MLFTFTQQTPLCSAVGTHEGGDRNEDGALQSPLSPFLLLPSQWHVERTAARKMTRVRSSGQLGVFVCVCVQFCSSALTTSI